MDGTDILTWGIHTYWTGPELLYIVCIYRSDRSWTKTCLVHIQQDLELPRSHLKTSKFDDICLQKCRQAFLAFNSHALHHTCVWRQLPNNNKCIWFMSSLWNEYATALNIFWEWCWSCKWDWTACRCHVQILRRSLSPCVNMCVFTQTITLSVFVVAELITGIFMTFYWIVPVFSQKLVKLACLSTI